MADIFKTVLDISLAASVLALLAMAARLIIGRRPNAALPLLSALIILRLAIPVTIPSPLSVMNLFQDINMQQPAEEAFYTETNDNVNETAMYEFTQPVTDIAVNPAVNPVLNAPAENHIQPEAANTGTNAGESNITADMPSIKPLTVMEIISIVWIAGIIAMAACIAASNIRFTLMLKKNRRYDLPGFKELLKNCKAELNITRHIEAVQLSGINTAAVYGVFRPKLLITPSFGWLSDEEKRHVLLHELSHIKRRDMFVCLLITALNAVYWFNPVIWVALMLARRDMEIMCDMAVLKLTHDRRSYASTLFSIAKASGCPKPKLVSALFIGSQNALRFGVLVSTDSIKRRMKMITRYKRSRLFTAVSIALVFAITITGCTGAVSGNENNAPVQTEQVVISEQPVKTPEPEITPTKAETPQVLISSYSLDNSTRMERDRVYNIEKALAMLDGYVIKPGEKMSLNEVMGVRSEQNGWRTAPGIIDGGHVNQYGAGVSAVSSALYNAAIRAELEIVEVKHYTIISDYIPPALDAALSNDGTDLVIANPYDSNVTIKARMEDKNIVIEIYGPPLGYAVDFFSKKTADTEAPPQIYIYNAATTPDGTPIPKGKSMTWSKSRKGVTYEVYKTIYKNGENGTGTSSLYEVYTYPAIHGYTYVNSPDPNDWRQKFPNKFSDKVEKTENSYKSDNISEKIEKVQKDGVTYFIADIYVAELKYFRTAFPVDANKMGGRESTNKAARDVNAILAINGVQCINNPGTVMHNGEIYREQKSTADVLVMNYDGSMQTYSLDEFDLEKIKTTAYQIWTFGPMLLKDGKPMTKFNSTVGSKNPRTAVGYYEPGHYCFVVADGRQPGYSEGMTLAQLSQLFADLGCTTAYNMDGGQSAEMAFMGKLVNHPYDGGRSTTDIIYIGE